MPRCPFPQVEQMGNEGGLIGVHQSRASDNLNHGCLGVGIQDFAEDEWISNLLEKPLW
jgi:hypothetical protein